MSTELRPLESLAAALEKRAMEGPRRHAAVHNAEVEIRELALRVLEDLDRRLTLLERRLEE